MPITTVVEDNPLARCEYRVNPTSGEWEAETSEDPTSSYHISDLDTSASTMYFGFVDKTGRWYILALSSTQGLYANGNSAYTTNWANRLGLSYDYFNNLTW